MKSKIQKVIKYIPLLICAGLAMIYFFGNKDISAETIFNHTPKNIFLAACFIILIYAVKSMSIVFPLLIIHIATGMIFTPAAAMTVNVIGTAVAFTIPYLYGKLLGSKATDNFFQKYSDVEELIAPKKNSSFVLPLILRTIYILPCDVLSMYFGTAKTSFIPYILGSLIGNLPTMISETLLGTAANDPSSPMFWISITASLVFSVGSIWIYRIIKKKNKNKDISHKY